MGLDGGRLPPWTGARERGWTGVPWRSERSPALPFARAQVFDEVAPLVTTVLDGYNVRAAQRPVPGQPAHVTVSGLCGARHLLCSTSEQ